MSEKLYLVWEWQVEEEVGGEKGGNENKQETNAYMNKMKF